jgi:hypothetical protein
MDNDENIDINTQSVTINTGWTPKMVYWNTVGTVAGALIGFASMILSLVAIWLATKK